MAAGPGNGDRQGSDGGGLIDDHQYWRDITFDFTGSSPQVASALNATASFTQSACYAALQGALGSDIPANSGFLFDRSLSSFPKPPSSTASGQRPSARGARGLVGYRIIDTVLGALAPAFPDRVPAAGDGGPNSVAVGIVESDGSSVILWDILCGSWGATPTGDGNDGISPLGANLANTPIEELEKSGHIRIDGYGYLPDTGGAGIFRGGVSTFRDMTIFHESASVQIRSDRRTSFPYGLDGGSAGAPSANIFDYGTDAEELIPSKPHLTVQAGSRHRQVTAGGGGYGDPLRRDPQHVLEDVLDGKVTVEGALRDYGVAIDVELGRVLTDDTEAARALSTAR